LHEKVEAGCRRACRRHQGKPRGTATRHLSSRYHRHPPGGPPKARATDAPGAQGPARRFDLG